MTTFGFFVDQIFWQDDRGWSSDEAYTLFPLRLADRGDRVVLIGRAGPRAGRGSFPIDHPNIEVIALPYYASVGQLWRRGRRFRSEIRHRVTGPLARWDALLVCGPNPVASFLTRLADRAGTPVALLVRQNLVPQVWHGHRGPRRWLGAAYAAMLETRFRRLAQDRVVFAVGQEMTDAYGRVSERVHNHVASLVDQQTFEALDGLEQRHRGEAPTPRLLTVGRLSPQKGIDYLLEALALLRAQGHRPALDIIGEGPSRDQLEALTSQLGLGEQVRFRGFVQFGPELLDHYASADALVVPSLPGEGFPQVINEALSAGLPVVASAVAGIPGFLDDGRTGLLVPPGDAAALAAALVRLIECPALRGDLADNGRALMGSHTLESNRDLLLDVLESEVIG